MTDLLTYLLTYLQGRPRPEELEDKQKLGTHSLTESLNQWRTYSLNYLLTHLYKPSYMSYELVK